MIRFLVFILITLTGCMVLLGATGRDESLPFGPSQKSTITVAASPVVPPAVESSMNPVHLDWSAGNMIYFSKIFVLIIIVLVAIMNYIRFVAQKEDS